MAGGAWVRAAARGHRFYVGNGRRQLCAVAATQGGGREAGLASTVRRPRGYWDSAENRRAFLDSLAKSMAVRKPEDWSRVRHSDVLAHGGAQLLARSGSSLLAALREAYPEAALDARACRGRAPRGYWRSPAACAKFVEELAAAHGVRRTEDWAHVTAADVSDMGGAGLLRKHGGSVVRLLLAVRPELEACLQDGRFAEAADRADGYWECPRRRRTFVEEAARRLAVSSLADWRSVSVRQVRRLRGGESFLRRYNGSLVAALKGSLPAGAWSHEAFQGRVPEGYWDFRSHRIAFLRRVMDACDVRGISGWQDVSTKEVVQLGGAGFLARYGNSLLAALKDLLPEMGYRAEDVTALSCRTAAPDFYWADADNLRSFFESVKAPLGIEYQRDWMRVSRVQLQELGCRSMLSKMTLRQALELAYPNQSWDWMNADHTGKKTQRHMHLQLCSLFGYSRDYDWMSSPRAACSL